MDPMLEAFWFGVVVCGAWAISIFLTLPSEEDGITPWERLRVRYFVTSSQQPEDEAEIDVANSNATTATTPRNVIAMAQNDSNELLHRNELASKAEALAAIVAAGKVSQTEGIKLVFGVSASGSNPRYQEARQALHIALQRLQPAKYAPLTDEQRELREHLDLS